MEKLDAIKAAKIWKDGKIKEYQTELTDVVREYISRRFDVQSTEKTSDETLKELKPLLVNGNLSLVIGDGKDLYGKLSKMLQLADLVKFAKWHTTPDENELALTTAYDFVKTTTPPPGVLRTATGSPIEQSSSPAQGREKGFLISSMRICLSSTSF